MASILSDGKKAVIECKVFRLGTIEFQKAWNLQNQLAKDIAEGTHPPTLLLLEHSHVYTFGNQGNADNLLWDAEELANRHVDVHWIDRGGDVTYHGPGQLVGYPLLPLTDQEIEVDPETGKTRMPKRDYVKYLRDLEKVIIKTLSHFGIPSGQIRGQTGVWVQSEVISRCKSCPPELYNAPAKIASIGVKIDAKGISRHGFALNVDPDMHYWNGILACGLNNQNKISMANLMANPPTVDQVAPAIIENFKQVFDYNMDVHAGVLLL
ncbi:MAG: lipoyl(octanoyl) transferase LipB [Chloroflexota bacterium]